MHELRETTSKITTFLYWIKIYYKFYTGFKVQQKGVSDPKVWDCLGRCQKQFEKPEARIKFLQKTLIPLSPMKQLQIPCKAQMVYVLRYTQLCESTVNMSA